LRDGPKGEVGGDDNEGIEDEDLSVPPGVFEQAGDGDGVAMGWEDDEDEDSLCTC
jgi:hypothetical protein